MEIRKFVEKCVAIAAVWIANLITRIANVTKIALFCTNYAGTNDKIIICSIKPVLSSAQQLLAFNSHLHFFFFFINIIIVEIIQGVAKLTYSKSGVL
jgi:hypothetical protein